MKISKTLLLATALLSVVNATPSGEELTKTKCATCHMLEVPAPDVIPTLTAPPLHSVLFHLKLDIEDDVKKQKAFIIDYALNPKASKSVCESNQVQKFGVMPSQKGLVTKEELALIADHMIKTYPSPEFVKMIKEMLTNGKMNGLKNSPFLMNQDELPHLTKMLMEHWDKAKLGLTDEQKGKLLLIRTETITGVKKVKKALKVLEAEVIEMTVDEEALKDIKPKVDEVAKLKAEAIMIQLKCLQESIKLLTDEQMEYILPFWDA